MRLERLFDSLESNPLLNVSRKYFVIFKGIRLGLTSGLKSAKSQVLFPILWWAAE